MIRRAILLTAAMLATVSPFLLYGQRVQEFGFAFYDVDKLYDTVPSPFCNDSDYTPAGRFRWTADRYERKTAQIASVLDSMQMAVVALFGVENEGVVRDIVSRSQSGYSYLHRTLDTFDGLDFALLYYGDALFPSRVESSRNGVIVYAEVGSCDYAFVLLRRGIWLDEAVTEIREANPDTYIVAAGRVDAEQCCRCGLTDISEPAAKRGMGNVCRADGWVMRDRVAVDARLESEGGVFVRKWLLDRRGRPVQTFAGSRYAGGAGGCLPVYGVIRQKID